MRFSEVTSLLVLFLLGYGVTCPKLTCNTQILRSFTLHSRITPNRFNAACPNVSLNCCTQHDQMRLHKIWAEHGAEHIKNKHNASIDVFKKLKMVIRFLKDYQIKGVIDIYEQEKKPKPSLDTLKHLDKLADHFYKLDHEEMVGTFDKFLKEYKIMLMKVKWLRMGFLCSLCEMHNHDHINVDIHTITYHTDFCKGIVKEFIDILAKKYQSIIRLILILDEFIYIITNKRLMGKSFDRYMMRRNLLIVDKCALNPFKEGECDDMCLQFNLNRFTDLFDGEDEVIQEFVDNFPDYFDLLIGNDDDYRKLIKMGKKDWTSESLKKLKKTDSLTNEEIKKDKSLRPKKKNSFGLQFKTPKIISFIERHHELNPLQIENLDDQLDPLILHKLADPPVDISRFIVSFSKEKGINLFRDSKKVHLHRDKEKLLAMIHAKDTNLDGLSEVLDDQIQLLLKGVIMTDYKSFLGDVRLALIKLGNPQPGVVKTIGGGGGGKGGRGDKGGQKGNNTQKDKPATGVGSPTTDKPKDNTSKDSTSGSPKGAAFQSIFALTALYAILF